VVRGVRGAATSDGRSVSGSQARTQTACHGTLFSLTTILKHSRHCMRETIIQIRYHM